MPDLLGYPGLIGAFILSIAIILPILVRSLKAQDQEKDRLEQASSRSEALPPLAAIECSACGQLNRVPLEAERALCGRCKGELITGSVSSPS